MRRKKVYKVQLELPERLVRADGPTEARRVYLRELRERIYNMPTDGSQEGFFVRLLSAKEDWI